MKKLLLAALLLPASLWAFQKNTPAKPAQSPAKGGTVTLTCRLYGTHSSADSVYLYENLGLAKRIVARAGKSGADSAYVLTVPAGAARFYSVGANEQSTAKVILGEEKQVTMWGNTEFMHKARTVIGIEIAIARRIIPIANKDHPLAIRRKLRMPIAAHRRGTVAAGATPEGEVELPPRASI